MTDIINRGTGAGGANTNVNGKSFEEKTSNEQRLLSTGFIKKKIPGYKGKNAYYLVKEMSTTESITYLTQGGLKAYFEHFFKKEMCRQPDEAYLFRNGTTYTLKVLEKKNQNTGGSVDTKLLAGPGFIEEYQILLGDAFTVKYKALRTINERHGIKVLYGDDADYYETLDAWINS